MMEHVTDPENPDDIIFECSLKVIDPFFEDKINFSQINFFLAILKELLKHDDTIPSLLLEWLTIP